MQSDVLFRHLQTHSPEADISHRYAEASKGERPRDQTRRQSLDATVKGCGISTGGNGISISTPTRRPRAIPSTQLLGNHQQPSHAQSLPSAVPSPTLVTFNRQSPSQTMADTDTDTMMPPTEPQRPDVSLEDSLSGVVFEDGHIMQLVPDLIPHGVAGSEASAESSNDRCALDPFHILHVGKPESPRQHMIQSQATRSIQDVESNQPESPVDCLPFEISQMLESQLDIELESAFQLAGNNQQDCSRNNEDFEMFSSGGGHVSLSSDFHLSFNVMGSMGYPDFTSSALPLSMSSPSNKVVGSETTNRSPMLFSPGRVQQIQRVWSRQTPKMAPRLIGRLWKEVVHHKADNIFTTPQDLSHSYAASTSSNRGPSRYMDEQCRCHLMRYCKELEASPNPSTPTPDSTFPVVEILNSSLDFFFQFFHPILPFMHKSTFDAGNTPSSLLLAMCLVGLSYLDRTRTRAFISRYLQVLSPLCLLSMSTIQVLIHSLEIDGCMSWRPGLPGCRPMCAIRATRNSCIYVDRGVSRSRISCMGSLRMNLLPAPYRTPTDRVRMKSMSVRHR